MLILFMFLLSISGFTETMRVGLPIDRPPYSYMENGENRGIEPDIIRAILKKQKIEFIPVTNARAQKELSDHTVEIISTSWFDNPKVYFSEPLFNFDNVAITKKASKIKINKVSDLKGKSVTAWQNASYTMGEEFKAIFHPVSRPDVKNYFETSHQSASHLMFWKNRIDVLITDILIFKWYQQHLPGVDTSDPVDYAHIFKGKPCYAVFTSKKLRDDFNKKLAVFKKNGDIKKIIQKYVRL